MAGAPESTTKIKRVQNTRKATRAMRQLIGHLAQANSEFRHPYLVERAEVKRVGYVIVSSDRGLAGGLNNNLFRKLLVEIRQWQETGVEVDVVTIGQKATVFFRR